MRDVEIPELSINTLAQAIAHDTRAEKLLMIIAHQSGIIRAGLRGCFSTNSDFLKSHLGKLETQQLIQIRSKKPSCPSSPKQHFITDKGRQVLEKIANARSASTEADTSDKQSRSILELCSLNARNREIIVRLYQWIPSMSELNTALGYQAKDYVIRLENAGALGYERRIKGAITLTKTGHRIAEFLRKNRTASSESLLQKFQEESMAVM